MKKYLKILPKISSLIFLIPGAAYAASIINDPTGGPVKEKEAISSLIDRLTQIVVGAAGIIAVAMIVWGGVQYMTSGGNEDKKGAAKKTLTWAIAGLIFTISAYAIVYVFTHMLGGGIS